MENEQIRVLKTSRPITKIEEFKLTLAPGTKRVCDHVGENIEVDYFALYEATGEEKGKPVTKEILSIHTKDGDTLGTISDTFKRDFFRLREFFMADGIDGEPTIKIIGGKTKADKDFVTCTIAE